MGSAALAASVPYPGSDPNFLPGSIKHYEEHCFINDLSTNTDPIHTTTQQPNFTVSFLSEFCGA